MPVIFFCWTEALGQMSIFWSAVALCSPSWAVGDLLWPPSLAGPPESWGNFDDSWDIFSDLAAQSAEGARTVARRATASSSAGRLMVHLSGTYNIPQEYSTLLKYGVENGFDTIGLNYGWGPVTDGARSAECMRTANCDVCQTNYHEIILTGEGEDLMTGKWPIFGDEAIETLKWVHFYGHNVQFIPEHIPPSGINLSMPLTSKERNYINGLAEFAIEPLLSKVLERLGWNEYLVSSGKPDWTKVVVTGHSQGASHSAYIAYARPVIGAMSFAGPQDACGDEGGSWFASPPPDDRQAFQCYAADERGRPAIEKNSAFFSQVRSFTAGGKPRNYGPGVWCPSPEHCGSAVDDQLVEDAVDRCFTLLKRLAPKATTPTTQEEKSSGIESSDTPVPLSVSLFVFVWPMMLWGSSRR